VKILFLSSWYPNRLHPHLGNFIQRHAEAVSRFHDVASLFTCFDPNLKEKKFDVETKNEKGVFTVCVYCRKVPDIPVFKHLMKYFRFQKAQRIGYRNITEHFNGKPDLIHLNVAFPAGLFAMKLKKRENLEYILTEHSTKYHIPTNPLESYYTKTICKKATVICPVSSDLKKVMEEKGYGKKFEVVPNVVDTDLFRIAEKKVSRKKKVIHISTLI
jgi:hypothetical protein